MENTILTKELFKKYLGDAFDAGINAQEARRNEVRAWGDFDEWFEKYKSEVQNEIVKCYRRKSTYIIEFTIDRDGNSILRRVADGFNAFEILGLFDIARNEIIKQIEGEIKPDIIKREVIV